MHCHFSFFGFGDFIGREGVAIGIHTGELMVAAGLLLNFGFFGFGEFVGGGGGLAVFFVYFFCQTKIKYCHIIYCEADNDNSIVRTSTITTMRAKRERTVHL